MLVFPASDQMQCSRWPPLKEGVAVWPLPLRFTTISSETVLWIERIFRVHARRGGGRPEYQFRRRDARADGCRLITELLQIALVELRAADVAALIHVGNHQAVTVQRRAQRDQPARGVAQIGRRVARIRLDDDAVGWYAVTLHQGLAHFHGFHETAALGMHGGAAHHHEGHVALRKTL